MANLIENLELADVVREDKNKAILKLIDRDNKLIYEVNLNKLAFDRETNTWKPNKEKAENVEKTCLEYVGYSFDELEKAIGKNFNIYEYDWGYSFYKINTISKFKAEHKGKSFQTVIDDIIVDDVIGIHIRYKWKDETYQTNMTYGQFDEVTRQWYLVPLEKKKKYNAFLTKFGVPVEEKEKLIGKNIIINVKSAFGTHFYGELSLLEEL